MSGSEKSNNLITLGRKVEQVGREGAEDGFLPMLASCDAGAEVLEDLIKYKGCRKLWRGRSMSPRKKGTTCPCNRI